MPGIWAVGCGYWYYWQYLVEWVRLVSVLAGFIILLFVGYYRITGQNHAPANLKV
jgi:hypothetical protein